MTWLAIPAIVALILWGALALYLVTDPRGGK